MRYARFLRNFFSFFFYRAARGIYIVSRRVHSWWDAFQRIVSFSLSFFFLFFSLFFFFGRALSSCIGSVLLIVTALSSFVDFENENATSQSFQPSNRPVVYRFSSSRRPETGGKLFSREEKERERERSDSSRNDSLECNKRAKEAVERTKEALVRRLWKFLLAFFEGSPVATRRRLYPFVCHELENPNLWTISEGRIFRFESNTVSRVYLPFVSREWDSIRHCRTILGDVGT